MNPVGFGSTARQPDYFLVRWLFLRFLGLVYLAALLSLWVQIDGLIGSQGILPVADFLAAVRKATGGDGYHFAPTLCWLDSGDQFLSGLCAGGVGLSVLLIVGLAPVPVLGLLWVFYLSLTVAGQDFLGYQWDALLLETGFLAIFFAPLQLWPRLGRQSPPSRLVVWLFRWLLFRLVFCSGVVKLLSGDPSWRSLTALHYHYETQPLPIWTSWYMHQLPGWFQQLSVLVTLVAELLVPLLIFGPRRCRQAACAGIVGLQLLIAATGNYGFFNLLTMVLCVLLLDDDFFPARIRKRFAPPIEPGASSKPREWWHVFNMPHRWSSWLVLPVAVGIFLVSFMPFVWSCGLAIHGPTWLVRAHRAIASFRSVNSYGLFAVMTTRRPEIIIEGSDDGKTWKEYTFRWKPGDPRRRPSFAGLHMPRLDWQMWFAALGRCEENSWFVRFLVRLLRGSPEVLALLDRNPFPDQPPHYIRAVLYQYHFTDSTVRSRIGTWWRREPIGLYCPVLSLATRPGADELGSAPRLP
jgi:hypothetical protein